MNISNTKEKKSTNNLAPIITIIALVLIISFGLSSCNSEDDVVSPSTTTTSISDTTTTTTDTTSIDSSSFYLTSAAIINGELLDAYKCETKVNNSESSIPLNWDNAPSGTNSFAVIMHHYPNANNTSSDPNSYLLVWGIDSTVSELAYGAADDGPWYLGANKDGNFISYTSPCSPSTGSHEYTITLYALSSVPASLPTQSSLSVTYSVLKNAIATTTVLGTASLTFNDVTL